MAQLLVHISQRLEPDLARARGLEQLDLAASVIRRHAAGGRVYAMFSFFYATTYL
jgi:hypothetical protein